MMKRAIIIIVAVLVIVVGVTAYLNRGDLAVKKESQDNAILVFKSGGQEAAKADMKLIKDLGGVEFDANLKSNGKEPVKHKYTGVPMKKLFEALNIDTGGKTMVVVKAVDGYTSAITIDEALDEDNVYIAYEIDGKPLGKKEDGGAGPFEMIISKDPFSQRWCKFAMEVELQ